MAEACDAARAVALFQRVFAFDHSVSQKHISYWSRRLAPVQAPGFVPLRILLVVVISAVMDVSVESIWLATAAVDMRTGIDALSLYVQQALGRPPSDGTAYIFAN